MSNKTQLQTNNTKLDALITRVNSAKDIAASLPEAGSSGVAASTSNVTLNYSSDAGMLIGIYYSKLGANGIEYIAYETFEDYFNASMILEDVVCNTNIIVIFEEMLWASFQLSDNVTQAGNFYGGIYAFRVIDTNNGSIAVTNNI